MKSAGKETEMPADEDGLEACGTATACLQHRKGRRKNKNAQKKCPRLGHAKTYGLGVADSSPHLGSRMRRETENPRCGVMKPTSRRKDGRTSPEDYRKLVNYPSRQPT